MKIAFLNPWQNAAENQAYFSVAAAARELGHELVDCRTSSEAQNANPEFVISVASSIPKVVDAPTYLTLHEPTKRFLENSFYLNNLLTYDGFLTISDNLKEFARDLAVGTGRTGEVGFYYNTPQRSHLMTDIETLASEGRLKLVYIGTNWDRRLPGLFRAMDGCDILRIHGPQASWDAGAYRSYRGPLPFDGISPQKTYAGNGMGLVLLSADHLREDVISNRIFEIASVSAIPICPGIPWIRKWFGDSVLYFDPTAAEKDIAQRLRKLYEFCLEHPDVAQSMAHRARAIFEKFFAAERLLENAINYHTRIQALRRMNVAKLGRPPSITVVIRCGGRPVEMVRQAVNSVRRQTFGHFAIILSKYKAIDLRPIINEVAQHGSNIMSICEILTEGGSRVATLRAGCRAIMTEYFAVLDDDDFWLSDHIEGLFAAGKIANSEFDVSFSGTICVQDSPTQIETSLAWNENIYTFGFREVQTSVFDATREFSSHCFVARSDLLLDEFLDVPEMESAEDTLLVAMLIRRKRPIFSYRATAFFRRGLVGQSEWSALSSRQHDEQVLKRRTSFLVGPQWINSGSANIPPSM